MNAQSNLPDLPTLRRLFGQRLRPGRLHKVHGRTVPERWVYRATRQVIKRELRPPEQIAKHVDKRPLLQLLDQINALMEQVCARAACGDKQALSLMISTARGAIAALESIEKAQPTKLKTEAEISSTWPVLLSLNPQDIKHAKEQLQRLGVGTKATTPRRPGQRLDPQNFWTKLAEEALKACENNKIIVPVLEARGRGAKRVRKGMKLWQVQAQATFYYLSDRDCIIIPDWEKQCVNLSGPITDTNFKKWWGVVQFYVLERWHGSKEAYAAALTQISDGTAPKEFQKRNLALNQVKKALRSLVGIRQQRG